MISKYLMCDKESCHSSLIEAAKKGCTKCVKLLIPRKAGLRDKDGETALMWAAKRGRYKCVKLLLPHEACFKDNNGKIALDYANNEEIRKLIQDYLEKNFTIYMNQ